MKRCIVGAMLVAALGGCESSLQVVEDDGVGGSKSSTGGAAATNGGAVVATGGATVPTGGTLATGGGAAGRTPVAGGGATGTEACSAPPETGDCDGAIPSWYHDPATGLCLPFLYGGCGGNANNYSTRQRCLAACRGGDSDLDYCDGASDCTIIRAGCCSACEPISSHQLIALRADDVVEYESIHGCGDVQCEPCLEVPPGERTGQFFYRACVNEQCTVLDVREQDFTRCESADDCRLRCGSGCCESCSDGEDLIAINRHVDMYAELCEDQPSCPDCECVVPEGATAECVDERCVVNHPPICTPGMDQTCNDNPIMSYLAGTCSDDGTCTCNDGYTEVPETGRCIQDASGQ